ncbi:hypothetical protein [Georgenia sp. SYP-B2076]|uniref:hypothetical protein n=1 Tax=Georgenia sp. SYP-B2076 TaxID=2495881 RepID=UPI000F8E102F|nr:hypothetical protein [Georgenia sp. SYP-B2076]
MALRLARRAVIAALGGALTLGGCSSANPITTQLDYAPSDGILVRLTDGVSVENLLILTPGKGQDGYLLGAVANNTSQDTSVTIDIPGMGFTKRFPAPAATGTNFSDARVTTPPVDAEPGATVPATVSSPAAGAQDVQVPVLDGTLPAYREYLAGR